MSFNWDEKSKNKLREFWASGLSTSLIGKEMGLTKNSIIGAAHRMKLTPRPSPIASTVRSYARVLSVHKKQERPVEAVKAPAPAVAKVEPKKAPHRPVSVAMRACCFPSGDPSKSNFRFCGKPAVTGKPYCAACCSIAYVKPSRAA